jgi:hypothetical protein
MKQVEARALTEDERDILLAIAREADKRDIAGLAAQVSLTSVTGGLPTMLDLAVGHGVRPVSCANGPLPIGCRVIAGDGEPQGQMLVWMADGYLSALEFAWITDAAPSAMPPADRLVFA